jgi:hypothetical protein
MKPTRRTLREYWFDAGPPSRLALLRILVGGYALWCLVPRQEMLLNIARSDPRLFAPVGVVFGGPVEVEFLRVIIKFRYQLSGVLFASFFPLERVLDLGRRRTWQRRHHAPAQSEERLPDSSPGAPALSRAGHAALF